EREDAGAREVNASESDLFSEGLPWPIADGSESSAGRILTHRGGGEKEQNVKLARSPRTAVCGLGNLFRIRALTVCPQPETIGRMSWIFFLGLWLGLPDENAPAFLVRPYLQLPTPTHMTIMWETSQKLPSRVEFGLTDELGHVVESQTAAILHEVALE